MATAYPCQGPTLVAHCNTDQLQVTREITSCRMVPQGMVSAYQPLAQIHACKCAYETHIFAEPANQPRNTYPDPAFLPTKKQNKH